MMLKIIDTLCLNLLFKIKQHNEKPYGFTLEFHFDENEFFKNSVLTKTYEFAVERNERNPLLSTNNSLYKCVGCQIDWNESKDVTIRVVSLKQKNKSTGTIRVVNKEEKQVK